MKKLLPILFLFAACSAFGAGVERISLLITITNVPTTSNTLTINATTRTWTNASTLTTILTNLVSTNYSTTNLYNQIASFPYTGPLILQYASSNQIRLIGPVGGALAGSASGGWAEIALSTQSGPQTYTALWPMENMVGETNRTNQGSALVSGLSTYSTNAFATNSTAVSNLLQKGVGPLQRVQSDVRFDGRTAISSNFFATNGFTSALTNINPVTSNLVNYGNAIRSEGSGGNSLQVGSNAVASALRAVAIGVNASATNTDALAIGTAAIASAAGTAVGNGALASTNNSTALGTAAQAINSGATALGNGAIASGAGAFAGGQTAQATAPKAIAIGDEDTITSGTNAIGLGPIALASGYRSIAIGEATTASHENSIALGYTAETTDTNQVRLPTTHKLSVPFALEAANVRNLNAVGTNLFHGVVAYDTELTVTTVANGHNVIDSSSNTLMYVTGSPSAAWTLGGFTGAKNDGRILRVINQTGMDVTIQNESGTAPTASDRILTYAGAGGVTNVTVTGNGVMEFHYSTTASRWILDAPSVDVISVSTNANYTAGMNNQVGIPFRMVVLTNSVTVTNTTSESSLINGVGLGTYTIPANYLTPGAVLQVKLHGKTSTPIAPGVTIISVKLGSTIVCSNITTIVASQVNDPWNLEAAVTFQIVGGGGAVQAQGAFNGVTVGGAGSTTAAYRVLKRGTTYDNLSIDTTSALTLDVTITPGATTTGITTTGGYVLVIP